MGDEAATLSHYIDFNPRTALQRALGRHKKACLALTQQHPAAGPSMPILHLEIVDPSMRCLPTCVVHVSADPGSTPSAREAQRSMWFQARHSIATLHAMPMLTSL